ncbi:MAG TPA: hypothetical protein VF624_12300 [Tepidisphaeraceae bacterium]|jgi:hypothetical protein
MPAEPIEILLTAEPFVPFTLHLGSLDEVAIDDPVVCRVDRDQKLLYLRTKGPIRESKIIEIIDLRLVAKISVGAF